MPPASTNSGPTLREWLTREGGAVPFRRFMEAALYDAEFGYYTRQIRTVGARGDFSTSATLSPQLARGIAAWIREEGGHDGQLRHLVEIGPGSGALHRALRQALGWRGRWRWRSHLVERSPVLRAEQRKTLGWLRCGVQWHDDPSTALKAAGGRALIFSNELVDAFPATLLQLHEGIWQEVWLELTGDGRLVEALRPIQDGTPGVSPEAFPEGQRIECHLTYLGWLQEWRPHWQAGAMLTIDYGDTADRLYDRRPQGTVRGYHRHRRLEGLGIYRNPGQCDLTADVNFSDLIRWGRDAGLETVCLESQAAFLNRYAPVPLGGDVRLQDPQGAGGAFLCLRQRPTST